MSSMTPETFFGTGKVYVGTGAAVATNITGDSTNQWIAIRWTGGLDQLLADESGGGKAATPNSAEDIIYTINQKAIAKTNDTTEANRNFAVSQSTLTPIQVTTYNGTAAKRATMTVNIYAAYDGTTTLKGSEI